MSKKTLKFIFKPATCAVVLTMALTGQVVANEAIEDNVFNAKFVEDAGGDARINYSGKLRMLSQRIPAAACNANAGVATEASEAVLSTAVEEFHVILDALVHGNDSLGIFGAEERRRTTRVIEEVHKIYAPVGAALQADAGGPVSDTTVQVLADENMKVLDIAKLLVTEISGEYANPVALLQSDAMAIDIAGRQRMLTQKMSKEVCLAMSGINADAARETLAGTINTFEVSLGALINGMDQVGITPPPNDEIAKGLLVVQSDWANVQPMIIKARDGAALSMEERAAVFAGLNTTLKNMNTVVGMYSAASKLDF